MELKPVVSLTKLTKKYGKVRGIEDITFSIYPGEVFGFLGPNGAGKTTAIRTLIGLIHATSGSAEILGQNALLGNSTLRSQIGYLPGASNLYKKYTAGELLLLFAKLRKIDCRDEISSLASRLNLDLSRKINDLSKGNRQKVGVIQAFMHKPLVIFLDEPTSGLDPLAQREFETILDEAKKRGAGIMLSSHVLGEVENLADRIAIISEGRLLVVDRIEALKERAKRTIDLHFANPVESRIFDAIPGLIEVYSRGNIITCTLTGIETELLRIAVANNVLTIRTHEPSLEDIFLDLIDKAKQ